MILILTQNRPNLSNHVGELDARILSNKFDFALHLLLHTEDGPSYDTT